MFHDLPNNFIYSAYKIEATFSNGADQKSIQGTAFVVGLDGGHVAFVTNRHVLELDYKADSSKYRNFKLSRLRLMGRRADDSIYRFEIAPQSKLLFPASYLDDVGLIVDPACKALENMPDGKVYFHFELAQLADDAFLSQIRPFDVVAFSGFPEEHDVAAERPIVRSGRIASDPRFEFSLNGKPAGHCVAYETFSHSGASGSPVFAPAKGLTGIPGSRDGRLIGVNAGHVNREAGQHAALSYFYKSTVILEVLRANGVEARDGA